MHPSNHAQMSNMTIIVFRFIAKLSSGENFTFYNFTILLGISDTKNIIFTKTIKNKIQLFYLNHFLNLKIEFIENYEKCHVLLILDCLFFLLDLSAYKLKGK